MKYLIVLLILVFVMACGQGMQEVTALDNAKVMMYVASPHSLIMI